MDKKVIVVLAVLISLAIGWRWLYSWNASQPFQPTIALEHSGSLPRRLAVAPVDWFRSRTVELRHTWLGRKYIVQHIGNRHFLQERSGEEEVAVEIDL